MWSCVCIMCHFYCMFTIIMSLFPSAVEKAMTYLSTQELPWDMDMPHKKQHQKKVCYNVTIIVCGNFNTNELKDQQTKINGNFLQ